MSLYKCKGIVIKTQDYKENDKLVWLYTDKYGKVSCIARGAKKNKNKLFSTTLTLCYGEFIFYKGKSILNLQEGKIIKSFQSLMDNLEKLIFSSYICELIDIALIEKEPDNNLFMELVTTMYLLDTDAIDYELLVRAFEVRLLKRTGYGLNLEICVICSKKISTTNYISLSYFGGICEGCKKEHGLYVSKGAYNAIKYLNKTPLNKVYRLNLTDDIKKEIQKVTAFIIKSNYSKEPKSLEMLNYLKE